jgi:hypothetical protein
VLIQTPYDKKRLGAVMGGADVPGEAGRGSVSDALGLLDRENYAYCIVDWRGFYGSKAAMEGVRKQGFKRGLDGYDCVEWLASQEWCNGRVGTWGGSALGKQQFDTAAEHPPHLVCCVPLIASMGQSYEAYYEGGVLLEGHVEMLDRLGYGVSAVVRAAPLPTSPAWRAAERLTYRPDAIEVPCLVITGWWDNFPAQVIRTFEDIVAKGGEKARKHSKMLIGPWDHVSVGVAEQGDLRFEAAAKESAVAAKAFFDAWLREKADNGWDKTPRVRYWTVNEAAWAAVESWSGIKRKTATLHLDEERIVAAKPSGGTRSYVSDPRKPSPTLGGANLPPMKHGPKAQNALDGRADVLAYSTGKLEKPMRINGAVELSVAFTANREDCAIVARLCDVHPDGKAVLLADAAARARVRDGEPKPLKPGERAALTLRFPPTAAVLPAGHALRIYLSSTNHPRYERLPNTGADHWDEKAAVDVDVTVLHDGTELRVPGEER